MSGSVYYSPENHGLVSLGTLELDNESYSFNLFAVFKDAEGQVLYGRDSGCSCHSSFEGVSKSDLSVISLNYNGPNWNALAKAVVDALPDSDWNSGAATLSDAAAFVESVKARYDEVSVTDPAAELTEEELRRVVVSLLTSGDYDDIASATKAAIEAVRGE